MASIQIAFTPDEVADALKLLAVSRGYQPVAKGVRFTTKVTIEDGVVTGADLQSATVEVESPPVKAPAQ